MQLMSFCYFTEPILHLHSTLSDSCFQCITHLQPLFPFIRPPPPRSTHTFSLCPRNVISKTQILLLRWSLPLPSLHNFLPLKPIPSRFHILILPSYPPSRSLLSSFFPSQSFYFFTCNTHTTSLLLFQHVHVLYSMPGGHFFPSLLPPFLSLSLIRLATPLTPQSYLLISYTAHFPCTELCCSASKQPQCILSSNHTNNIHFL